MVLINHAGREINAKIVYYGPGLSGKTTNLECIYASVPNDSRGKMVSMKTRQDRTLFFDFLPLELGEIHGFRTRFLLYTVPGQVFYNATRKLVLKGVDAVVFVADSALGKLDENLQSLHNLEENLRENNLSLDAMPWVIQYNKRDLPQVHSIDEMQQLLNPLGVPSFEAAAATGRGVYETLHAVSRLLFLRLRSEFGRHAGAGREAGSVQPRGALAAAPVSTSTPWSATVAAPAPQTQARPSTMLPRPAAAPQAVVSAPTPVAAPERSQPGAAPVDYGRTVELPAEAALEQRHMSETLIRDPLRRRDAALETRAAEARSAELRLVEARPTESLPASAPTVETTPVSSDQGGTVLRVPVVIKRSDLKPGVPLQLVLELLVEP